MRLALMIVILFLAAAMPAAQAKKPPAPFRLSGERAVEVAPVLKDDGTLHLNNKICPLMDRKTRMFRSWTHEGVHYRLCCFKCRKMMREDPAAYALPESEIDQLRTLLHA